ncbi:hypothetical protein H1P_130044 [Hyella patelloides LEGE 07179]|uniref:Uncharacterized protein n=1 Tax=Hyella patelloides LEGE 07179 TaxID=945734 RepID=A0A563VKQ4_9CYAN|nr:hypothetical protein [Hyella patelloides]VEP12024.1 hypothetical protein H1P_130044 [Hyella patelloides LEGE 07179]
MITLYRVYVVLQDKKAIFKISDRLSEKHLANKIIYGFTCAIS